MLGFFQRFSSIQKCHQQVCNVSKGEKEGVLMIILKGRPVPPFVTAHTFCASRDIRVS